MKLVLLAAARVLAIIYGAVPTRLRNIFQAGLFVLESRIGDPADALRRLFLLQDRLQLVINERATAYGKGEHPKHRLIAYHDFFVSRIPQGSRVLDVGSGYGAVARSIAHRVKDVAVTGIDNNLERLTQAQQSGNPPNLEFLSGEAPRDLPDAKWDVVVMSNVLEHVEHRVEFLRTILVRTGATIVLIRVPLFERDWQVPMREELGISYFSDPSHFIEHKLHEFDREINDAGLYLIERILLWGEIWARCTSVKAT